MSDIVATALALQALKKTDIAKAAADMAQSSADQVSNALNGISTKTQQIWAYQDFNSVSSDTLTLSSNQNGSGWAFDATKVIDNSASVVLTSNSAQVPYTSGVFGLLANQVSVITHSGSSITLSAIPKASDNAIRVWYKISIPFGQLPNGYSEAPNIVIQKWMSSIDTVFATDSDVSFKYSKEWHVDPVSGDDTNGTGAPLKPIKTLAKLTTLLGGSGEKVMLHPGTYAGATFTAQNVTFEGSAGGIVNISGTTTFSHTASSVRCVGLSFTTLIHSGAGNLYLVNSRTSTSLTSSGAGYLQINDCDTQGSGTGFINITGSGSKVISGGNIGALIVNNSSVVVSASNQINAAPMTLTSGTLALGIGPIYSASATANALTATGGVLVMDGPTFLTPLGTSARVNIGAAVIYDAIMAKLDAVNSVFLGTQTNLYGIKTRINSSSSGYKVSYQNSSATYPASPASGDWLIITSDGTRAGSIREQWVYDATGWTLIQGSYPVSGSVIDNSIANSNAITTVGRYIVPTVNLLNSFTGKENQFADFDGSVWSFSSPPNNTAVTITTGVNSGQTWKYLSATGWEAVKPTTTFNAPAWVRSASYTAGDIRSYSDGNAYIALASIPQNTAFSVGETGAKWKRIGGSRTLLIPNFSAVAGDKTSVSAEEIEGLDAIIFDQTNVGGVFSIANPTSSNKKLVLANTGTASVSIGTLELQPRGSMTIIYTAKLGWMLAESPLSKVTSSSSWSGALVLSGGNNRQIVQINGSGGTSITLPFPTRLSTGATVSVIWSGVTSAGAIDINISGVATPIHKLFAGECAEYTLVNVPGNVWKLTSFTPNSRVYRMPDNAGVAKWIKVGTWYTTQYGKTLAIKMTAHEGFNAISEQNATIDLHFKTSNGVDSSAGLFVDGNVFFTSQSQRKVYQDIRLYQVSQTEYALYVLAPIYSDGSMYDVSFTPGTTWKDEGLTLAAAPATGLYLSPIQRAAGGYLRGRVTLGDIGGTAAVAGISGDIVSATKTNSLANTYVNMVFASSFGTNPVVAISIESMGTATQDNKILPAIWKRISANEIQVMVTETDYTQNLGIHVIVMPLF